MRQGFRQSATLHTVFSLLTNKSDTLSHSAGVGRYVEWCDQNYLLINTKKTEEVMIDARSIGDHPVISIHNNDISQVSSYKYLGVQIDKDMSWSTHVTSCCSKIHQRLHFLRRLRLFGVSVNIMLIFYRASRVDSKIWYRQLVWKSDC